MNPTSCVFDCYYVLGKGTVQITSIVRRAKHTVYRCRDIGEHGQLSPYEITGAFLEDVPIPNEQPPFLANVEIIFCMKYVKGDICQGSTLCTCKPTTIHVPFRVVFKLRLKEPFEPTGIIWLANCSTTDPSQFFLVDIGKVSSVSVADAEICGVGLYEEFELCGVGATLPYLHVTQLGLSHIDGTIVTGDLGISRK